MGSECTALSLSSFNTTTEVSLSKTPNPQLLPGRRSINGCPLLCVCLCVRVLCVCACSVCVRVFCVCARVLCVCCVCSVCVCVVCVCVCVFCVCVCVCSLLCVHVGWVKCRAQIPSMSHHTWPYVTSLSLCDEVL